MKMTLRIYFIVGLFLFFMLPTACPAPDPAARASNEWTWVSGSDLCDQAGVYGTKGIADPANVPGARWCFTSRMDSSDTLWLFGGHGYDGSGGCGYLNDLWKFDGANWTWVSGSNTMNHIGVYGTKGLADPANVPGTRSDAISWMDSSGNFWLFGGIGFGSGGNLGELNDLWKFDGTNWTWVSGSDVIDQSGTYGTKGIADPANIPGGRIRPVVWRDSSGNFWLFGGKGYDGFGSSGHLSDLWKFDGTNWTWISGPAARNQPGAYGVKGTADPANVPGARQQSVGWMDSSNNLWLFGGDGYDGAGTLTYLNDLWKFNGLDWTWISGSSTGSQSGVYGVKGRAAPANIPGSRLLSIGWSDSSGDFRLFGGDGYSGSGLGELNDLWEFDGVNWTWVSGSDAANQSGAYGVKGTADPANIPGGRFSSIGWRHSSGSLYLFGGSGYDSAGTYGRLNDLWKYQP